MKFKSIAIISLSLCLLLFLSNCIHKHDTEDAHSHDSSESAAELNSIEGGASKNEPTHLSNDQMKLMDIQFGDFTQVKINDFVRATGTLDLPPKAYSSVSAKVSGFIGNSKNYVEGNYVVKGEMIAYLESAEIITHQQAYLEKKAELDYLQQELARQQELLDNDAGILKHVQKLKSEVLVKRAGVKGYQKQLEYWGVQVTNLTADNIIDQLTIRAPKAGYISSINIHNGLFVSPETELMEIVSEDHLHLELDVFERDFAALKVGQRISYIAPAIGNQSFEGEVQIIGKEFNTENKTVRIHGHLEHERPPFIKDLFVEAKIWLNDQTMQALPEEAILKDGTSSYLFVGKENEEEVEFQKIGVIPGSTDQGFTAVQLINPVPEGMKIVTKGAYYVYAQSMAGELEHEH